MSDEVLKAVDQAESVIAAVYVVPTAGQGHRRRERSDELGRT